MPNIAYYRPRMDNSRRILGAAIAGAGQAIGSGIEKYGQYKQSVVDRDNTYKENFTKMLLAMPKEQRAKAYKAFSPMLPESVRDDFTKNVWPEIKDSDALFANNDQQQSSQQSVGKLSDADKLWYKSQETKLNRLSKEYDNGLSAWQDMNPGKTLMQAAQEGDTTAINLVKLKAEMNNIEQITSAFLNKRRGLVPAAEGQQQQGQGEQANPVAAVKTLGAAMAPQPQQPSTAMQAATEGKGYVDGSAYDVAKQNENPNPASLPNHGADVLPDWYYPMTQNPIIPSSVKKAIQAKRERGLSWEQIAEDMKTHLPQVYEIIMRQGTSPNNNTNSDGGFGNATSNINNRMFPY